MNARSKILRHAAIALAILGPLPLSAEKPDVHARILVPASVAPGSKLTVVVELTIGSGWHVNSHTPAESFLVPTELSLTTSAGTLSPVRYPPQAERRFSFSDKPLRVYEGTVRFEADLVVPTNGVESISIAGTLAYQACNEHQCFAPAKIPLDATVSVARSPENKSLINPIGRQNLRAVTQ